MPISLDLHEIIKYIKLHSFVFLPPFILSGWSLSTRADVYPPRAQLCSLLVKICNKISRKLDQKFNFGSTFL